MQSEMIFRFYRIIHVYIFSCLICRVLSEMSSNTHANCHLTNCFSDRRSRYCGDMTSPLNLFTQLVGKKLRGRKFFADFHLLIRQSAKNRFGCPNSCKTTLPNGRAITRAQRVGQKTVNRPGTESQRTRQSLGTRTIPPPIRLRGLFFRDTGISATTSYWLQAAGIRVIVNFDSSFSRRREGKQVSVEAKCFRKLVRLFFGFFFLRFFRRSFQRRRWNIWSIFKNY